MWKVLAQVKHRLVHQLDVMRQREQRALFDLATPFVLEWGEDGIGLSSVGEDAGGR